MPAKTSLRKPKQTDAPHPDLMRIHPRALVRDECQIKPSGGGQKGEKGAEYSEMEKYAKIFCDIFAMVSVKNFDIFHDSFFLKKQFFFLS